MKLETEKKLLFFQCGAHYVCARSINECRGVTARVNFVHGIYI